MISSSPSSRVVLLHVPGTAADVPIGSVRIRRYRLARVRRGARAAQLGVGAADAAPTKSHG